MNEIYKYKSDIEHRLLEVRNKETKFQLLKGISIFTIFAFLFLIVLILLENLIRKTAPHGLPIILVESLCTNGEPKSSQLLLEQILL